MSWEEINPSSMNNAPMCWLFWAEYFSNETILGFKARGQAPPPELQAEIWKSWCLSLL